MGKKLTPILYNEPIVNKDLTATPKLMLHLQLQRGATDGSLPLDGGTLTGPLVVPDEAFSISWNGSFKVPTQNAVYDKIVSLKFTDLSDVPSSYSGNAFKFPQVNSGGTSLQFANILQLPAGGATGTILQKYAPGDGLATWSVLSAGIVAYTPAGNVSSTNVQSAINELDTEKAPLTGAAFSGAITVPNVAYGAGWNSSAEVPTKDAVYDKMETKQNTLVPPSVQVPGLNAPWINYGGGFLGARYWKTAEGLVVIEGVIQATSGSPTSGVTLFTLLAGYSPSGTLMFVTWNGSGAGRIDVDSAGNVVMQSGNTAFTSLNITFMAQ